MDKFIWHIHSCFISKGNLTGLGLNELGNVYFIIKENGHSNYNWFTALRDLLLWTFVLGVIPFKQRKLLCQCLQLFLTWYDSWQSIDTFDKQQKFDKVFSLRTAVFTVQKMEFHAIEFHLKLNISIVSFY